MKQLPVEGQKIQLKLKDGDWQDAVYRDGNFEDLYGLPLGFDRILEWRPVITEPRVSAVRKAAVATSNQSVH